MPTATRILVLLLAAVCACSGVDFIAPRVMHLDPADYEESRLISYRTLDRTDFRAATPPEGMDGEFVAAVTAALIRTSNVTFSIQSAHSAGAFVATVDNLRFEARMSQDHSWWNPRHARVEGELLAHEQVHFALAELAARRANADLERIKSRVKSMDRTPEAAIRRAADRLQREVDRLQDEVTARNIEFDRETVNGQLLDHNQRWFVLVQSELDRSRADYLAASRNTSSHPAR